MKQKLVITGSTGRVGQALLTSKRLQGYEVHAIVRSQENLPNLLRETANIVFHVIDDLALCDHADLIPIFRNAVSVIHLATAIFEEAAADESATALMAKNVAAAVAEANIRNVVVLSSIYARLASEGAANARTYGYRKLAAERYFEQIPLDKRSVIVLRPPAVYGPGMGGTLKLLAKLVRSGIPLPLGLANENRDYISIGNLTDLIWKIVDRQTNEAKVDGLRSYEPSDGKAVTTKALASDLALACGRKVMLFQVPTSLLDLAGKLLGKSELVDGALGRLEANGNTRLMADFGWLPLEQMPASLSYLQLNE